MLQGKFRYALVTGGAGFIGSFIVEKLLERGLKVNVIDDLSMGRIENLPDDVQFFRGSILDTTLLKDALEGVDVVFHNAAKVSIRNSFENVYKDTQINVLGTVRLLDVAGRMGIKKFIYASSMAVYSGGNPKPLKESSLLEPLSPYGIGKLAGERYVFRMSEYYGFDAVCLRYFNTFGPRQTVSPYVGVITIFTTNLLRGIPPVIFGDGNQIRDFIFVEDVAEANIHAMEKEVSGCAINVATGIGTTVNQIANLLIERISPRTRPVYAPHQQGEPRDSFADISLLKGILGFKPRWSLEDKIDTVIEWNRKLLNGKMGVSDENTSCSTC